MSKEQKNDTIFDEKLDKTKVVQLFGYKERKKIFLTKIPTNSLKYVSGLAQTLENLEQ